MPSRPTAVTIGTSGSAPASSRDPPTLLIFRGCLPSDVMKTEREADGKVVKAVHYVALSKRLSPQRLLEVTRRYWSVENQCHWRLDVAFYEDDARTRKNYGPQNLAVLRRIALDILSAHPDKRSVGRKMKLAAWSKDFFFDLFAHLR